MVELVFVQHLLFSVIDPQFRAKPAGVSDVSLTSISLSNFLLLVFSFLLGSLSFTFTKIG